MSADRIADLEREVLGLKLELGLLIQVLSETKELPILAPGLRWDTYHEALGRELAKARLKIQPPR